MKFKIKRIIVKYPHIISVLYSILFILILLMSYFLKSTLVTIIIAIIGVFIQYLLDKKLKIN